ncbi:MAG: biotin-dependent carboxyltransferase family protein [Pyrinomonadaceae bacterium]
MSILIRKPGILTTIQDTGRHGFRKFGINPGGAMDQTAARLANIILCNDENAAVIEAHFPAPEIVFEDDTLVALGGADFAPGLDGIAVENWRCFNAEKGSTLRFKNKNAGNRCYIAVRGGVDVEKWLGSASTSLTASIGGYKGRKLEAGDRISINAVSFDKRFAGRRVSPSLIPMYRPFPTVRVVPCAEFTYLSSNGLDLLEFQDFTISHQSNRMGFRLTGSPIALDHPLELVSSAVCFGTIQLLPDGQLIVLMADHQTTGGYPRLAQVISRDLPLIAQLGANEKVAFYFVDVAHAEELAEEFERDIAKLRIGARMLI